MGIKRKLKICFIGGGPTIENHIQSFTKIRNVELTAIFNRTRSKSIKLSKKYNIKFISDNVEDLYFKFKADAVIVAVSIDVTKKICEQIFKFNWVCLLEKPLGYNFRESKKIFEIYKKGLAHAFVALNRRNYNSILYVKNAIKKISGSRIIEINDQQNFPQKKKISLKVKKNWFYANSIHMIDLITFFTRGKMLKIVKLSKFLLKRKNYFICKIYFSSGDMVLYKCAWNLPGEWSLKVINLKKKFTLSPLNEIFYQDINSKKMIKLNLNFKKNTFKDGFRNQALELIKFLNKKKHNLATINDSLKTMKLIKNIYK